MKEVFCASAFSETGKCESPLFGVKDCFEIFPRAAINKNETTIKVEISFALLNDLKFKLKSLHLNVLLYRNSANKNIAAIINNKYQKSRMKAGISVGASCSMNTMSLVIRLNEYLKYAKSDASKISATIFIE